MTACKGIATDVSGAVTLTSTVDELLAPVASNTVNVATNLPAAVNTWSTVALLVLAGVPSAKSHWYWVIEPVEEAALKFTESGAVPVTGVA